MSATSQPETNKPVIVIVPASFSPPSLYSGVVEELDSHGYDTVVIHLPSVGSRSPLPAATMAEDAGYITSLTTKLADEGKEIVLVMHSYGGICGTESTKGVSKAERAQSQLRGGVVRLFYISSPVPRVGDSIATQMGDNMPEFITIDVSIFQPGSKDSLTDFVAVEGRLHVHRARGLCSNKLLRS
ncbi:hypothetical protein CLAIMM_14946, partial [Cladophialophora immunda]